MAIVKIDPPTASTPSYNPSISVDYNAQNDILGANSANGCNVSLGNWDDTISAPIVLAGSTIESNGIWYRATTDQIPSNASIASGLVYLTFNDDLFRYEWTSTVPSWSASLAGWYCGGERFTGFLCRKQDATTFIEKVVYNGNNQNSDIQIIGPGKLNNYESLGDYLFVENSVNDTSETRVVLSRKGYVHLGRFDLDALIGNAGETVNYVFAIESLGSTWFSLFEQTGTFQLAFPKTESFYVSTGAIYSNGGNYALSLRVTQAGGTPTNRLGLSVKAYGYFST